MSTAAAIFPLRPRDETPVPLDVLVPCVTCRRKLNSAQEAALRNLFLEMQPLFGNAKRAAILSNLAVTRDLKPILGDHGIGTPRAYILGHFESGSVQCTVCTRVAQVVLCCPDTTLSKYIRKLEEDRTWAGEDKRRGHSNTHSQKIEDVVLAVMSEYLLQESYGSPGRRQRVNKASNEKQQIRVLYREFVKKEAIAVMLTMLSDQLESNKELNRLACDGAADSTGAMAEGGARPMKLVEEWNATEETKYRLFYKVWALHFTEVVTKANQSDACNVCCDFRKKPYFDKLPDYRTHRALANHAIEKDNQYKAHAFLHPQTHVHLTFDYSEDFRTLINGTIQPNRTHYMAPPIVELFGIRSGATGQTVLNWINEGDGVGTKDADAVTSMLDHYITHNVPETVRTLYLAADNCFGQNKNRYMVGYAASLVARKRFDEVRMLFRVVGHTKSCIDAAFGVAKIKLRAGERFAPKDGMTQLQAIDAGETVHWARTKDWLEHLLANVEGISQAREILFTRESVSEGNCLIRTDTVPEEQSVNLEDTDEDVEVTETWKTVAFLKRYVNIEVLNRRLDSVDAHSPCGMNDTRAAATLEAVATLASEHPSKSEWTRRVQKAKRDHAAKQRRTVAALELRPRMQTRGKTARYQRHGWGDTAASAEDIRRAAGNGNMESSEDDGDAEEDHSDWLPIQRRNGTSRGHNRAK